QDASSGNVYPPTTTAECAGNAWAMTEAKARAPAGVGWMPSAPRKPGVNDGAAHSATRMVENRVAAWRMAALAAACAGDHSVQVVHTTTLANVWVMTVSIIPANWASVPPKLVHRL